MRFAHAAQHLIGHILTPFTFKAAILGVGVYFITMYVAIPIYPTFWASHHNRDFSGLTTPLAISQNGALDLW